MADAMFAPVVTRVVNYDVTLDRRRRTYGESVLALPEMMEWTAAALKDPESIEEFEVGF